MQRCPANHRNSGKNSGLFSFNINMLGRWRRDRDSNPGDGFPPTHFPGVRLRPLGHLSNAHRVARCDPIAQEGPARISWPRHRPRRPANRYDQSGYQLVGFSQPSSRTSDALQSQSRPGTAYTGRHMLSGRSARSEHNKRLQPTPRDGFAPSASTNSELASRSASATRNSPTSRPCVQSAHSSPLTVDLYRRRRRHIDLQAPVSSEIEPPAKDRRKLP